MTAGSASADAVLGQEIRRSSSTINAFVRWRSQSRPSWSPRRSTFALGHVCCDAAIPTGSRPDLRWSGSSRTAKLRVVGLPMEKSLVCAKKFFFA
jgi:hypothetical protein